MATLPQLVINSISHGIGFFTVEVVDLYNGDCHGAVMDTKLGATCIFICMRFNGKRYPVNKTVKKDAPYGVMVSHVIGALSIFNSEVQAEGFHDGRYEVTISDHDLNDDYADWSVVYGPYQGPGSWNGRY